MCIYCGTSKYRRIYEQHNGPIPKDDTGRSYEIHHIDGNHSNNEPSNLVAVTLQEHYDIHYAQGDWYACKLMAQRLALTREELSLLGRNANLERVKKGTHNLLRRLDGSSQAKDTQSSRVASGTHQFQDSEFQRSIQKSRVAKGTHPFLGGERTTKRNLEKVAEGTHPFLGGALQRKRVSEGTHNFLSGDLQRETQRRLIENGTHPSMTKKECEHCGKKVGIPQFAHWHGDNCKYKPVNLVLQKKVEEQ